MGRGARSKTDSGAALSGVGGPAFLATRCKPLLRALWPVRGIGLQLNKSDGAHSKSAKDFFTLEGKAGALIGQSRLISRTVAGGLASAFRASACRPVDGAVAGPEVLVLCAVVVVHVNRGDAAAEGRDGLAVPTVMWAWPRSRQTPTLSRCPISRMGPDAREWWLR